MNLATTEDGTIARPAYAGSDPFPVFTLDTSSTLGVVTVNPDGSFFYDPRTAFNGLAAGATGYDSFIYRVEADGMSVDTLYNVEIAGVNDAPTVVGGLSGQSVVAGASFDLTLDPGLFADVDGDALTISAGLAGGGALPSWLSFDGLTGHLSGVAPADFTGILDIMMSASDGSEIASTGFTLTVTVPPIALTIGEDDPLVTSGALYTGSDPSVSYAIDTSGALGTAVLNPAGTVSYSPSASFQSLAQGATAIDRFTVTITADGQITTKTVEVTVNGVNDGPVLNDTVDPQHFDKGQYISVPLPTGLFTDPDGDNLSYIAYLQGGATLPSWLTIDSNTGTLSGDPGAIQGKFTVQVQASDGLSTAKTSIVIEVGEAPVILQPIADQAMLEDSGTFVFDLPAGTFFDPDGDVLSYSITQSNGKLLPDWITVDAATGTISATPPLNMATYYVISLTASDGGYSATTNFRFDILNTPDAPTAVQVSSPWISDQAAAGSIVGLLEGIDPDRLETFTYTLVNDGFGQFAIDGDHLVLRTPVEASSRGGYQTVTVRATDSTGLSVDSVIPIKILKNGADTLFSWSTGQTNIYVAKTGDDTIGDGSAANPYATIQHAIDAAMPGTTINVKAGTYAENLYLKSGTSSAPIKLISVDGIGAAEIKPDSAKNTDAIAGRGIQNFTIEGFKITGTDTIGTNGINLVSINYGAAGSYENGYGGVKNENVLIKDNIITNWGVDGIHIGEGVGIQVIGNTVNGAHEQGIDFVSAVNVLIANNYVENITAKTEWTGLDARQYTGDSGITIKGGAEGVRILNNFVGSNRGYGIKVGNPTNYLYMPIESSVDGDGSHYTNFEARDVLVKGNTSTSTTALGGMELYAAQNVVVEDNLLSSIRVGSYSRQFITSLSGLYEQFLPAAVTGQSSNIAISKNVYTGSTFITQVGGVENLNVDATNTAYSAGMTYDPATHSWVNGVNTSPTAMPSATLSGGSGNDVLHGDKNGIATVDYINGYGGSDQMYGGKGNDTYVLDRPGDQVFEYANEGIDTVLIGGSVTAYTMAEPTTDAAGYIENAIVTRNFGTLVTGNSLANQITGGIADDQLKGLGGIDTLYGGAGNDNLDGGLKGDYLYGGEGNDMLFGGTDEGVDYLDGGAGRDDFRAGGGNDFLVSEDADALIHGGAGTDTLYLDRSTATWSVNANLTNPSKEFSLLDGTRIFSLEILYASTGSGDDTLIGGAFGDQISSGDGADYVDGAGGDDFMWTGAGNDKLYGGDGADTLDGNAGYDKVFGGAGDDIITSTDTDILLDGGDGYDRLLLTRTRDTTPWNIDFSQMQSGATLTLNDGTQIKGFESVSFVFGFADDHIIGASGNDSLNGSDGNDFIDGGAGNDSLTGAAGNDTIYGGLGSDSISGGTGVDMLYGGAGDETYTFYAGEANGDIIYDFEGAGRTGGDKLRFLNYGAGATITYDAATAQWVIANADNSVVDHLTIVGVTRMISTDFTLY